MRITCPHCGTRNSNEFAYAGAADIVRPAAEADVTAWNTFVHIRTNPAGVAKEYWQHVNGCRSVLLVERDTLTHTVISAKLARPAGAAS